MEKQELKNTIGSFEEYFKRKDNEILTSITDLDGAISVLSNPVFGNGLLKGALTKALGFVKKIDNPSACWKVMDILRCHPEPKLVDLFDAINSRAGELISGVSDKNIPKWFEDLLKNPEQIAEGFVVAMRDKAKNILSGLNENSLSR